MLIEYKIKFEKDGLTIAQYIEPNSVSITPRASSGKATLKRLPATQNEVSSLTATNPLAKLAAKSADGGGPANDTGKGPADDTGTGPADDTGTGGPADDTGTGSRMSPGGPQSAPIFILGPIVFGNAVPEHKEHTEPPKPQPQKPARAPKARGAAAGEQG
jgi:hypothetical protein